MVNKYDEIDEKMISIINKKLLEVERDDANGVKWLTREEADNLMPINNEIYA